MRILQAFVDTVGDLIGTSKRSRLNRNVFKPVLGTNLTRREYNEGIRDSFALETSPSQVRQWIKEGGSERRKETGSAILEHMTEEGVVFSEGRLCTFIANLQTARGENPISYVTSQQLSDKSEQRVNAALQRQHFSMRSFG